MGSFLAGRVRLDRNARGGAGAGAATSARGLPKRESACPAGPPLPAKVLCPSFFTGQRHGCRAAAVCHTQRRPPPPPAARARARRRRAWPAGPARPRSRCARRGSAAGWERRGAPPPRQPAPRFSSRSSRTCGVGGGQAGDGASVPLLACHGGSGQGCGCAPASQWQRRSAGGSASTQVRWQLHSSAAVQGAMQDARISSGSARNPGCPPLGPAGRQRGPGGAPPY